MKLIIAITGASGAIYGIRLLEFLKNLKVETHLIVSKSAVISINQELKLNKVSDISSLADYCYNFNDISASIASGSFKTDGMIIAPCSINTMSMISTGNTNNLITRAADVCLKERRKLVLMVRETPLHLGHLRTMVNLSEIGAIIAPPVPAFYTEPKTIDDIVNFSVGRILDMFDLNADIYRWKGV